MNNLIPLVALFALSTFALPTFAGESGECEKKCEKSSDECCKEGKASKKNKKSKASTGKESKKSTEGETKPTETK